MFKFLGLRIFLFFDTEACFIPVWLLSWDSWQTQRKVQGAPLL